MIERAGGRGQSTGSQSEATTGWRVTVCGAADYTTATEGERCTSLLCSERMRGAAQGERSRDGNASSNTALGHHIAVD